MTMKNEQEPYFREIFTCLERGVYEGGYKEGEHNQARKIILNMYRKGISSEEIADLTGISFERVRAIIEENTDENQSE